MRWLVFALSLVGCGGPCARSFTVGADFTVGERGAIERAADRWNAVSARHVCLEEGGESVSRVVYGSPEWAALEADGGATVRGGYVGGQVLLVAFPDERSEEFELTAMHEFGHAIGLGHVEGPGIMGRIGSAEDLTESDIEECHRAGACGSM